MRRINKNSKALVLNLGSLEVNLIGQADDRPSADIFSHEVLDFAARLALVGTKKGRTNYNIVNGAFDEPV